MNQTIEGVELYQVSSSQVYSIGHNEQNALYICFKNKDGSPGSIYKYDNFSFKHFLAFKDAESIGSYFYRHIKSAPHTYPYKKIS